MSMHLVAAKFSKFTGMCMVFPRFRFRSETAAAIPGPAKAPFALTDKPIRTPFSLISVKSAVGAALDSTRAAATLAPNSEIWSPA